MKIELSDDNLFIYAAKNYYNPKFIDAEEFTEDLNRFKYIKRLCNRYIETGTLAERLVLNHLIVVFNVLQRIQHILFSPFILHNPDPHFHNPNNGLLFHLPFLHHLAAHY